MSERLDRIEAICDRNAEAITRNAAAIDRNLILANRNFESVNVLVGGFESLSDRITQMLDIMQQTEAERQADRTRLDQLIETVTTNQQKIAENENRFETLLAESRADRLAWQQQLAAQREEQQQQLATQREEWQQQREEWHRQITAQNQAIQALLVQMARTNDRIDRLEAS
ncbi:MAG: hypothetical protein WBD47_04780 [Phormidesmis sp.]